jgi:hypothetical protein
MLLAPALAGSLPEPANCSEGQTAVPLDTSRPERLTHLPF